jgi:23S rRNA (uridine2552-2'-O)-methyltransferase
MADQNRSRWLREHFTDPYVKQAQQVGYRSRAIYKLLELHNRYHLFKSGMVVIDLGAAPGSWSQLVAGLVRPKGRVTAVDVLPVDPIVGVEVIQGDFTDKKIAQRLSQQTADWVISDMAPNVSGVSVIDQPRMVYLAELALDLSLQILKQGEGGLLVKVFQGSGFDAYLKGVKYHFRTVTVCKPRASRGRSKEVYILARGLKSVRNEETEEVSSVSL